jgi:hypothetical protein
MGSETRGLAVKRSTPGLHSPGEVLLEVKVDVDVVD